MSELQLGLLALGIAVVVIVVMFNAWQERKLRRAASKAFVIASQDPLLEETTSISTTAPQDSSDATSLPDSNPGNSEFRPDRSNQSVQSGSKPIASTWALNGPDLSVSMAMLGAPVGDLIAMQGLPSRLAKLTRIEILVDGNWHPAVDEKQGNEIRVSLQMADRSGPLGRAEIAEFSRWLTSISSTSELNFPDLDVEFTERSANELDSFCSEVDIQIAIHVVSQKTPFPGTRIRAIAESAGLILEPDGVFRRRDETGLELFRMENGGAEKFQQERMRELSTTALVLAIDVPTAPGGVHAFNRFRQFCEHLATGLGGLIVDDNQVPMDAKAFDAIVRQLSAVYQRMLAKGIGPGSPESLRLFT